MTQFAPTDLTRRGALGLTLAGLALPRTALAAKAREITWDDLIPPGVPYGEIIAEGEMDEAADTWRPVYDTNAFKLNEALDGAYIRMPGYIIPLEIDAKGVTEFLLVPYVGACIHVPPPPPNQLVLVKSSKPWPGERMWEAIWVEGELKTQLAETELAESGYALRADKMEVYEW